MACDIDSLIESGQFAQKEQLHQKDAFCSGEVHYLT